MKKQWREWERDSGCVANREIMYAPLSLSVLPSQRKVHTHDAAHTAALANRISIAARIAQLFLKGMCSPMPREQGARSLAVTYLIMPCAHKTLYRLRAWSSGHCRAERTRERCIPMTAKQGLTHFIIPLRHFRRPHTKGSRYTACWVALGNCLSWWKASLEDGEAKAPSNFVTLTRALPSKL